MISENREKLLAKTLLPSKLAIRTAQNKLNCINRLREFGVSVPMSFRISKPVDLKIAIGILQGKGHKKFWLRAIEGAGSRAALPIPNWEFACMWINYWDTIKDVKWGEFMISEFLEEKEYAFQSIWKDGELITSQARERIEYLFGSRMPSGQSSSPTVARTVSNDQVNETSIAGIKALDNKPNGIYCVDLKENSQGIPCITEINAGRFFTTSIFFSIAGCNMPYMYIKSAFNETLPLVKKLNPLPEGLYWIRQIDMQERLVREDELDTN
jgi:carbamoyl-phosphate synthase large subunit